MTGACRELADAREASIATSTTAAVPQRLKLKCDVRSDRVAKLDHWGSKIAPTIVGPVTTMEHAPTPEQAPDQPANVEASSACADRVTWVPYG